MKIRVKTDDGLELSTICRQLKMKAPDGKMRKTDCADVQGLLRIIQSIPSPKAEPLKQWLAKVGYERIQDMSDPVQSIDRAREYRKQHGRSEKWIHFIILIAIKDKLKRDFYAEICRAERWDVRTLRKKEGAYYIFSHALRHYKINKNQLDKTM